MMTTVVYLTLTLLFLVITQGLAHGGSDEGNPEDEDDRDFMGPEGPWGRRRRPGMDPEYGPYGDMMDEMGPYGNFWFHAVSKLCRRFLMEAGPRFEMDVDREDGARLMEECEELRHREPRFAPSFELMRLIFNNPDLSEQLRSITEVYDYH